MAKQGILDLRNRDFEKDGNIRLDGDWEFYWHELLSSKDFDTVKRPQSVLIPRRWEYYKRNGEELPNYGYASYRLKILINPTQKIKRFGLKFPDQGTAFELFLKDSLLGKNGKIAKSKEKGVPQYKPLLISFDNPGDTIEFVCWISNYHFHFGGLYFIPEFGNENQITHKKKISLITDYCVFILLLIFSYIFLNFYIFRPKEKASLAFCFVCLFSSVRAISIGERIITEIFPTINWEILIKFEALSWLNFGIFIWLYLRILFKKEYSVKIFILITVFYSIIDLITIFFPARINTYLINIGQIFATFLILLLLYIIVLAVFRRREGAIILFFAFLILAFAGANDILYYNGIMPSIISYPIGVVILSLSQISLLSKRFSNALEELKILQKN